MDYPYFMGQALEHANQALHAGEFPVGCIITHNEKIIASGSRQNTKGDWPNEMDHAEMVALRCLAKRTEYVDPLQLTVFCTMEPCLMCLGAIILCGISTVVYAYEDVMGGGTTCDLMKLKPLYSRHHITFVPDILRKESLALFKRFFANPANAYWRGSLLANYTLRQ